METPTKLTNKQVVLILNEALAAMEVKGYNIFRIRAYQNAISTIDNLTTSVYDLWENKRLSEIPGVGQGLDAHLNELFKTGKVAELDSLKKDLPAGMFSLIGLRGIGAKKAFKLAVHFKLIDRDTAIEKLKKFAEDKKIEELEGFGEESQKKILDAINDVKMTKNEKERLLLYKAEEISDRLISYMKKLASIKDINALGSLRRRNATVGDLDIAVATSDAEAAVAHFAKYPEIEEIISKGEKKLQVVLKNDIQIDFRVSTPKAYGSMLQYFTGSKQHNVLLRTYALDMGLSLSEYGIKEKGKLHEYATEEAFYKKLKLDYIAPELRQGKNEIELAKTHSLPKLIGLSDIKGDIHTHTTFSDGNNTLEEMTDAAIKLGYAYYGIADHAPSVQARGYKEVEKIIKETRKKIDQLNSGQKKTKFLYGYEVNILADATLAMPDELLAQLDYVIASIHTSFDQPRDQVTKRLIKALENPYVTVIGHPSGRLINEREACDINWREVFKACIDNDKILEINSQPSRLDLADDLVLEAVEKGIKLIINTDAHDTTSLYLMRHGVDVARRGFCEANNVVNTLNVRDFLKIFCKNIHI